MIKFWIYKINITLVARVCDIINGQVMILVLNKKHLISVLNCKQKRKVFVFKVETVKKFQMFAYMFAKKLTSYFALF